MNHLAEKQIDGPQPDPRWELVLKIESSQHFRRAAQLRAILLYIADQALRQNSTDIPERDIAVNVLNRRNDFDPDKDNIVRVQARQLRKKLDEYFEMEGRDEPWILTIPKGSYIPEFMPRLGSGPISEVVPDRRPGTFRRLALPIVFALLIVSVGISALLWRQLAELDAGTKFSTASLNPLWARVFAKGQQTNIVAGDSSLLLLQRALHTNVTLEQYMSRDYPQNILSSAGSKEVQDVLGDLALRQFTGFGELNVASKILELSRRYQGRAVLRFARNLNIRDLKNDNFVMLGGRMGLPWDEPFERQLGYVMEYDTSTGQHSVRDKLAGPGGAVYRISRVYRTSSDVDGINESYAVIALVPNLSGKGAVLLLLGLTMGATEAAEELLTRADFPAAFRNIPGCHAVDLGSQSFEILIRTKAISDVAQSFEVLACRQVSTNPAAQ